MNARFTLLVLAALYLAALAPAAEAQPYRTGGTPYARAGTGVSVSEADIATYALEMYSFVAEAGYQFTPSVGLGGAATFARYPKAVRGGITLTTLTAMLRWTLFPGWRTTPYFNVGPQVTLGGVGEVGVGATAGLGVNVSLSRHLSFFAEATAHAVTPDVAVDGRNDGRAFFDGLGFWGIGLRATLDPAPAPPRRLAIEGPRRLERGTPGTYTVTVAPETTRPIEYQWYFGDGRRGEGLTAEHAYRLPDTYTLHVVAENAGGIAAAEIEVQVVEPTLPARILALSADSVRSHVLDPVRLTADLEGTAPVTLRWDFGTGAPPLEYRIDHRFEEVQPLGTLQITERQRYTYAAPDTYTVILTAENRYGTDRRSIELTVGGRLPLVASCAQAVVPGTITFAFDGARLTDDDRAALRPLLERLRECPALALHIDGGADAVGPAAYNRRVALRRAEAVADFFRAHGIAPERLSTRGMGEYLRPCPPDTAGRGCAPHRNAVSLLVLSQPVDEDRPAPVASRAPATREPGEGRWTLIAGSHTDREEARKQAEDLRADLEGDYRIAVIQNEVDGQKRYRVSVGQFESHGQAQTVLEALDGRLPSSTRLHQLSGDVASGLKSSRLED